jgi:Icc-related predicted phosphoesterase
MTCFFVSDLHGRLKQYQKLLALLEDEPPDVLFMGGDILPSGIGEAAPKAVSNREFINQYLVKDFINLKYKIKDKYPETFVILGNDDGRAEEKLMFDATNKGIWKYIHNQKIKYDKYDIYGYAFVPPSPFLLKDWERYDVSRYVDPGCISPEEGVYTSPAPERERKFSTIARDLEDLIGDDYSGNSIFLFHTPPYKTNLDRAALDGRVVDHVQVDINIGSIAVRNMIERRQPLITLHGHIHESARLTGSWQDKIGRTFCFTAAHDGPELAVVRFNPEHPEKAVRDLI